MTHHLRALFAMVFALPMLAASAQDNDILVHIPPAANTIVLIDVEKCLSCPLARNESWVENYDSGVADAPVLLSPEANKLIMAARIDPLTGTTAWELAVMELNDSLSMRTIARAEGGYLDQVNGLNAVWSPRNAYALEIGPKTVGVMYPANRQYLSRWADYCRNTKISSITPYLERAVLNAGDAQIVMAMDLKDVMSPHDIGEKLAEAPPKNANIKDVGKTLMSLQGVTLAIEIHEKALGTLTVDFDERTAVLAPFAKPMILKVLDNRGAAIEDFENWKSRVTGRQVTLNGELSKEGLRRILSVIELPTPDAMSEKGAGKLKADDSREAIAKTTRSHFKSVRVLVNDIHSKRGVKTLGQKASWMETYARKIDRLSVLNVDPEMVTWSHQVSVWLRESAKAWRQAGVNTGARRPVYGNSTTSGLFYAGSNSYRNAERNQVQNQENAIAAEKNLNNWETIENSIAQMRTKMTQRYSIEF